MSQEDHASQRRKLEQAIAVQESLRGTVDESIIEVTISALRKQLDEFQQSGQIGQQRKLVTILFVDVVESTRLLRELDPEENLDIMDTALKRLAAEVEMSGGQVTRFMGDGFLAVFGLAQAKENDPEMAVRAGLAVIETTRKIARELELGGRVSEFRVRVGINTGLIVAGGATEAEGTLSGTAVNLAARLESAAPPNSVLISIYTQSHIRGIFDLESGGTIEVKGLTEPVQVFRVLQARPRAFRLLNRGVEGVETQMIGRDAEMQVLQRTLQDVLASGSSRFVTIIGEAGLGKSRLLEEFENWIDLHPDRIMLFKGRSTLERMGLPYTLLRDIFAFRFNIQDNEPIATIREKFLDGFRSAHGNDPHLPTIISVVGQLLGYDFSSTQEIQHILNTPQALRDRAFVYLVQYFKSLAANGPIAIFLDDVHWADESSLDMLLRLYEELSEIPLMIVVLTRPAFFESRKAWIEAETHLPVFLKPLSKENSVRLLETVLQRVQNLPESLRDIIIGNAEGNPFYLEELVKMLLEKGVIIKGEPHWQVRPEKLFHLSIPQTLTGVIQARLESLPGKERMVLQQSSVVGRVFWDDVICALQQSGEPKKGLSSDEVHRTLSMIQKREMIYLQPFSGFSNLAEYSFKHAVLRDVTYESVLIRDRKKYHAKVADWLIEKSSEQAVDVSGLIAGHLEKAGRLKEAFTYLKRAAVSALSNSANDEASDFFLRALAVCSPEDHANRFEVLTGLELTYSLQGDRVDQREILTKLHQLSEQLGDPKKVVEVLLREVWLLFWTSDYQEMQVKARRAVMLSEQIGDPVLIQQANYAEAWASFQSGDKETAFELASSALNIAREHHIHMGEGNTLNILGLIQISQGNYYQALEYLEEFLKMARESKLHEREVTALSNLSVLYTTLGNYPAAVETIETILIMLAESGDRQSESTARINYGWVAQAMGDWERAKDVLESGLTSKVRIEHLEAQAEGQIWLGYTWLGLGEPENAHELFEIALAIRKELNQEPLAVEALSALALANMMLGNLPDALKHVEEILSYLSGGGTLEGTWEPLRIYWNCVQVLKAGGDTRYGDMLEEGQRILQERAARIPDETYRNLYLHNIQWHAGLISLWEQQNQ